MVAYIIVLLIAGLIVGAIARFLVPGRDPIGVLGTIVLGIVGSFVGGFLENLVQYHTFSVHQFHATGLIGSVISTQHLRRRGTDATLRQLRRDGPYDRAIAGKDAPRLASG